MKTIYIVTSGSYSDYGIRAVFDSEELASKFAEKISNDDPNVEEWEVNPNEEGLRKGYEIFDVIMDKFGNTQSVNKTDSSYRLGSTCGVNLYRETIRCTCFAKDMQHAIKIVNEKRLQVIAENRW